MSNFVVLQRTQSEIDVFGGDVYIDIDGKNAGIVKRENLSFDLPAGEHVIKMYKSHTMGSFIGFAEVKINIENDEKLYARYSAPLMVNQPGNILIAPFDNESDLYMIVRNVEKEIHADYKAQQVKEAQAREDSKKNNTSLALLIILGPILAFLFYWIVFASLINW